MSITAGEGPGGYRAPAAGETVRVPVDLWDWIGVKLGGVTYDQVTVTVKQEGAASPTSWTAWATGNWVPVLNTDGLARYEVVFSGDDATEVALLNTPGTAVLSVICDDGHGETEFKVNAAALIHQGEIAATSFDGITAFGLAKADAGDTEVSRGVGPTLFAGVVTNLEGFPPTLTTLHFGGGSAANDRRWHGAPISFLDGVNAGETRFVSDFTYVAASGQTRITWQDPLPAAPARGDAFKVQRGSGVVMLTPPYATTVPAPGDPHAVRVYAYPHELGGSLSTDNGIPLFRMSLNADARLADETGTLVHRRRNATLHADGYWYVDLYRPSALVAVDGETVLAYTVILPRAADATRAIMVDDQTANPVALITLWAEGD